MSDNETAEIAETATTEVEEVEEVEAAPSDGATTKKKNRTLWIVVGIVIAIAIIVAIFIGSNLMTDNTLREQAEADLAQSPEITELVLPNKWVTQTGFELKEVITSDVDRADPDGPDTAQVCQVVIIGNGNVESLSSKYTMHYARRDGAWQLESIEGDPGELDPIAPISDTDIKADIGLLLTEADQSNANPYSFPSILAEAYGDAPDVEIVTNDLEGGFDNIDLTISASSNGLALEGELSAIFSWLDVGEDAPGWTLNYIQATPDTFYQISTVPREGVSAYASEEEQETSRTMAVAWDEFYYHICSEIEFETGSRYAYIGFENLPNNDVDQECTITLDSTGEVLYQSERISPNHVIDTCTFTRELDPGVYDATVTITTYERGTNRLVSMNSKITKPVTITVRG